MEEQSSVVKNTSLSWIDDFGGGVIWFQVFRFGVFGFRVFFFFFCVGLVSGLFFVFDLLGDFD